MMERIRSTTSGSAPHTTLPAPPGVIDVFTEFESLSSDIVAAAITRLPDKSSAADAFPVSVLKGVSYLLTSPFLATGCVYTCFFQGLVRDADPKEVGF